MITYVKAFSVTIFFYFLQLIKCKPLFREKCRLWVDSVLHNTICFHFKQCSSIVVYKILAESSANSFDAKFRVVKLPSFLVRILGNLDVTFTDNATNHFTSQSKVRRSIFHL
jgi:hypothetical protein